MSALPLRADIAASKTKVRLGPLAAVSNRSNQTPFAVGTRVISRPRTTRPCGVSFDLDLTRIRECLAKCLEGLELLLVFLFFLFVAARHRTELLGGQLVQLQSFALRIDCISHHMSPLVGAVIRRRFDDICHHHSRRYVTAITEYLI